MIKVLCQYDFAPPEVVAIWESRLSLPVLERMFDSSMLMGSELFNSKLRLVEWDGLTGVEQHTTASVFESPLGISSENYLINAEITESMVNLLERTYRLYGYGCSSLKAGFCVSVVPCFKEGHEFIFYVIRFLMEPGTRGNCGTGLKGDG